MQISIKINVGRYYKFIAVLSMQENCNFLLRASRQWLFLIQLLLFQIPFFFQNHYYCMLILNDKPFRLKGFFFF